MTKQSKKHDPCRCPKHMFVIIFSSIMLVLNMQKHQTSINVTSSHCISSPSSTNLAKWSSHTCKYLAMMMNMWQPNIKPMWQPNIKSLPKTKCEIQILGVSIHCQPWIVHSFSFARNHKHINRQQAKSQILSMDYQTLTMTNYVYQHIYLNILDR